MSEREKVFLRVEDTNLDELTDRLIEALFGGSAPQILPKPTTRFDVRAGSCAPGERLELSTYGLTVRRSAD